MEPKLFTILFCKVLRTAYLSSLNTSTIVNVFKKAGIYVPNRTAIDEQKLLPSQISKPTNGETLTTEQSIAKQLTLTTLEELGEETMKQFKV